MYFSFDTTWTAMPIKTDSHSALTYTSQPLQISCQIH